MRFILLFAVALLALSLAPRMGTLAQPPAEQDATLRAVEQRARQDAKAERPRATIQDLNALYGERARTARVSLEEVVNAYEVAYDAAKPAKSFWDDFLPSLGWIAAAILFFLALFRDTLRDVLGPRLKALGDKLYDRLAGYPAFWWKARANYRKSLVGLYRRFKIPFMADRYLDMDQIYVPLKVEGASDIDQIVDFGEVARFKRLVVTGQPGSGKSMLLRRLALMHATGGLKKLPDQPTPVLFELHRLNKEDKSIFEHLVAIFRLHKFPDADSFIRRSLSRGKLMLLFDGLDEVDSGKRAAEVRKIRDFILENDACRVMITCRSAVYRGEFDELAHQRLEIVDFSDQQIESFLKAWPGMPPNKSVAQLLGALNERPLIKALARRPLLLTIIAFLYTEVEEFRLPHSRADFYKRAAEVLLGGLKGELNKYEAVEKQFVLEHLALFNQTKKAKNEDDRLTLDRQTVLAEIRKLMPEMSRKEEDAPSVLEEIVERSSLMLPLDNKSRYVFSHLTLQEYFAASALRANHAKLLEHFAADRDAWRETAKLWCGLAQDSTDFIRELYKLDPVAALECLADAKRLTTETADAVVDSFKEKLGTADGAGDIVNKAFGAAATGDSSRNRRIREFLVRALHDPADPRRRAAAAAALSLTNSPDAADELVLFIHTVEAEAALVRMGDTAVPALERCIVWHPSPYVGGTAAPSSPVVSATRVLAGIGTPKAVDALLRLLWHEDDRLATLAALNLGSQFQFPKLEPVIRDAQLPPEHRLGEWYSWIWSPFGEDESTLAVVTGRIAFLVDSMLMVPEYGYKLDPRIAVPLVVNQNQHEGNPSSHWGDVVKDLEARWPTKPGQPGIAYADDEETAELFRREGVEAPVRELFRGLHASRLELSRVIPLLSLLDAALQVRLVYRLSGNNRPTLVHWRNIFNPIEFTFLGSLQDRAIGLVLCTLPAFSIAGALATFFESDRWLTFQNVFSLLALAAVLIVTWSALAASDDSLPDIFVPVILFQPLKLLKVFDEHLPAAVKGYDLFDNLFFASPLPLNIYLGSLLFMQWVSAPWVAALWVALLGPLYLVYWLGMRKERLSGNPLVGLLDRRAADNGRRQKL